MINEKNTFLFNRNGYFIICCSILTNETFLDKRISKFTENFVLSAKLKSFFLKRNFWFWLGWYSVPNTILNSSKLIFLKAEILTNICSAFHQVLESKVSHKLQTVAFCWQCKKLIQKGILLITAIDPYSITTVVIW